MSKKKTSTRRTSGYLHSKQGKLAHTPGVYRTIPLDELHVDFSYQRKPELKDIKAIVDSFDPLLLGQITVTERRVGRGRTKYYKVDGNHRCCALRDLGFTEALCYVVPTKGVEDEARLFHELNTTAKPVHAFDLFKSRIRYEDEVAVEIGLIVGGEGMILSQNKERNTIAAVKALEAAHVNYGNLPAVLRVLRQWQDGDAKAFDGVFITDLASFFDAYPDAVEATMIRQLRRRAPIEVKRRAKSIKAELMCSRAQASRLALKEIYNDKLPPKKKLRAPKGAELV